MIKYLLLIILTLSIDSLFSQTKTISKLEEIPAKYFIIDNSEIRLTDQTISINHSGALIFARQIEGKKIFQTSPDENYFLISNFNFAENQSDYAVEIFAFNKNGEMIFSHAISAHYDLPHPLFAISDEGIAAYLDLLTLQLSIIQEGNVNTIALEKDPAFEMERSCFIDISGSYIFVLASIAPTGAGFPAAVNLYKTEISNLAVTKTAVEYTAPIMLKTIEDKIFISGIKLGDEILEQSVQMFDKNLNLLAAVNNTAAEALLMLGDKYYIKFNNNISQLNKDLTIDKTYSFENGARIKEMILFDEGFLLSIEERGTNILYKLDKEFNIDFSQTLDIFGYNLLDGLISADGKVLILMKENTLIYY